MPITTEHIRETVDDYLAAYPAEKGQLAPVLSLLDAGADLTSRKEFRGHATAGAVLVDPAYRVLHLRHLALDRWLLPGGHVEGGDARLVDTAQRELTEETGIPASAVVLAAPDPLHVDVHRIPANDGKGEPEHQHFDFRFLFRTSAEVGELQSEEVTAAAWRDVATITDETLRNRVTRALH
ncbi:NUDIX domain-containing protein [Streptomyces sp. 891-h]|uniref:NUDIX hydrolase n=1 Tax=unclassified Streptomyces TaxID=2593676 RepID=UPI001FAA1CEE|nr:NUDIX domain-containing protein [Streptomyces sp. 891-h]UNZ19053.1 NUDIX domain-containing protein [Streptomyces sp. 891-h]